MAIVVLDSGEGNVAFRRMADPLQGENKGNWHVRLLEEAFAEALSWKQALEKEKAPEARAYGDEFGT